MCGKYLLDEDNIMVAGMIAAINRMEGAALAGGDISPSSLAPACIYDGSGEKAGYTALQWGYPLAFNGKRKLLINARSETVETKVLFREDFEMRRCLLPASGFYEWDAGKKRYAFRPKAGLLWLGGLYHPAQKAGERGRFVILTREPQPPVAAVHPRMPVLIPKTARMHWLRDRSAARELMGAQTGLTPLVGSFSPADGQCSFL